MKTITAENLPAVSHENIPVITTELLAALYGTEPDYIRKNHSRNTDRFVAGKHYFLLEADELREFKHSMSLRPSVKISPRVRSLILWTERGAARHAKMLETDQAWEVFEKLEDCYFAKKANPATSGNPIPTGLRFIVTIDATGMADFQPLGMDIYVGKVEHILSGLRERGWLVIKKELLAEKLATW